MPVFAGPGDHPVYQACTDAGCPAGRPGSIHAHLVRVERADGTVDVITERFNVRFPDVEISVPDEPWAFMVADMAALAMQEAEVDHSDIALFWADVSDAGSREMLMETVKRWVTVNE